MNRISLKSLSCSLMLISLGNLSHAMQRNYAQQQAAAPAQRQITLPSPQEQQMAQLEQQVTQELHQILEELGVTLQANTSVARASLQAPTVVAKAQEFIKQLNLDEVMDKLNLDQAFEPSYMPLFFHNLMMLPSHAITLSSNRDVRGMASYDQMRTCFVNHVSSVMLMADHLFQLHQNQFHMMNELNKQQPAGADSEELMQRVSMIMMQGQMFLQHACEDYLQTALTYTTALWIAKQLSLEELQSSLAQQKKNLLLQMSAPLALGMKCTQFLVAAAQQAKAPIS
jgi:hypothetical protein